MLLSKLILLWIKGKGDQGLQCSHKILILCTKKFIPNSFKTIKGGGLVVNGRTPKWFGDLRGPSFNHAMEALGN